MYPGGGPGGSRPVLGVTRWWPWGGGSLGLYWVYPGGGPGESRVVLGVPRWWPWGGGGV